MEETNSIMLMKKQEITYTSEDVTMKGLAVWPSAEAESYPVVLVVHTLAGRDDFAIGRAEEIARLGYVAFAVDLYGDAKLGGKEMMQTLLDDRPELLRRIQAAVPVARSLSQVDPSRTAAIGFCFGGLTVLDLARSGSDVLGVTSFHALLRASGLPEQKIHSKILALHGAKDPLISDEQLKEFIDDMNRLKPDWQLHIYGEAIHSFTNPKASSPQDGYLYNEIAARRSWKSMENFLEELFS